MLQIREQKPLPGLSDESDQGERPKVDKQMEIRVDCLKLHHSIQSVTIGTQSPLVDMAYLNEKKAAPKRGG
jgi:hypothetical protein